MKKIIIIIFMYFLLCGCDNNVSSKQYINQEELTNIIAENNYIIIDVRTKEEYDELHVKDSINIPYDEIDENIDLEKEKIILVYCRSGNRSNKAYQILSSLGYTVYDLKSIHNIDLIKE